MDENLSVENKLEIGARIVGGFCMVWQCDLGEVLQAKPVGTLNWV